MRPDPRTHAWPLDEHWSAATQCIFSKEINSVCNAEKEALSCTELSVLKTHRSGASVWWEIKFKVSNAAERMPMEYLHKHGTPAGFKTLFPNISGGTSHYFWGSWECLRGAQNSYGEIWILTGTIFNVLDISGKSLSISGSTQHFWGVLKSYGQGV